jgi:hypothetical protein
VLRRRLNVEENDTHSMSGSKQRLLPAKNEETLCVPRLFP